MTGLLPHIESWFLRRGKHFKVFAEADSRLEGWFKAEMLVLLQKLREQKRIKSFKREVKELTIDDHKRKQIDFVIQLDGVDHYCELKALCISQAAGTPRDLRFYFRDDKVGIIKDFKKLDQLNVQNKWVLGFVYPNPHMLFWNIIISSIPSSLSHWKPITTPQNFPDYLFLSLWKG